MRSRSDVRSVVRLVCRLPDISYPGGNITAWVLVNAQVAHGCLGDTDRVRTIHSDGWQRGLYSMNCINALRLHVICMGSVRDRGESKNDSSKIQNYATSLTTPPASLIFALQAMVRHAQQPMQTGYVLGLARDKAGFYDEGELGQP